LGFGATPSLEGSALHFTISSSSDCNRICRNLHIQKQKSNKNQSSFQGPTIKTLVNLNIQKQKTNKKQSSCQGPTIKKTLVK